MVQETREKEKKVKICPRCGYRDNLLWRHSRFDYNADYMRFEEASEQPELAEICKSLDDKANFYRVIVGPWSYYRRGKGGIYLYRVLNADFRVHRERKRHV